MRISYLELRNYRRFKELKLQFPDGIVGILGLNGVGKSTIIESIAWALFGNVDEVVRTSRESVRRAGAGPSENCSAVLEFELGGVEYRIFREMGGKSLSMRAELKSKGGIIAEGDKPVRKMVERLLGMDHKSFFTSVFARQKELNALQNVAPGERKKVVLRMLRIDGIDAVLTSIRADARDIASRIEGARRTLVMEDGRERETVLKEELPGLEEGAAKANKDYESAERKEHEAAREFEVSKKKRDELKKDVDAYSSSAGDLKAKQSALKELKKREDSISDKIAQADSKLVKLKALEKDEADFKQASESKNALEREKAAYERAKSINEEIKREGHEADRRRNEIQSFEASVSKTSEVASKLDDIDKAKAECEAEKASLSTRIGEARARASEKRKSAEEDKRKLAEIKDAGKEGTCPTCERRLEETYDLLVKKLSESALEYLRLAEGEDAEVSKMSAELQGVARKEEALKRKRTALEQDITKAKQQEAALEIKRKELQELIDRIGKRNAALAVLGEIRFSEQEYAEANKEFERLKTVHDEFTRLKTLKDQREQYARDLTSVHESIHRGQVEEQTLSEIVKTLEPKKSMYESILKELDDKTATLNHAKDLVRNVGKARDRLQADLDTTKKDLEEISRIKKTIEADRKAADDLALLEDVVVNFKDNLISRIAPTLSELTSRNVSAMTEGRYAKVELDEDYDMKIEDQGEMYSVSRFSGGEADLANLSLRLAISGIIADRTGASPINVLILDEIFGSQDINRKRSVMIALSRLSVQFRQIFLITHIEDVKDSMNYVIKVEELEDGTSAATLVS